MIAWRMHKFADHPQRYPEFLQMKLDALCKARPKTMRRHLFCGLPQYKAVNDVLVSEIMVKDPLIVSPDTSVKKVAELMQDKTIGSVILVKNEKLVGIVTERDLVRRVLANGMNPSLTKAIEICSRPVVTTLDLANMETAISTMANHKIHRLVVVNTADKVVGILTTDDIWYNYRRMSEELANTYMIMMAGRR